MESEKLSPLQKKIGLVSFIFCAIFVLLLVPFILLSRMIGPIDPNYVALLEVVVVAPLALGISVWLYDNKVRPVLERRNDR